MASINNANPREALTFDDVLIRPGLSNVMPSDVDIRSRITRSIALNMPIMAEAMIGILSAIERVMRERISTSDGITFDRPGRISTSSKVSASRGFALFIEAIANSVTCLLYTSDAADE